MRLTTTNTGTAVLFSASEVASVGLPARAAQVEYDNKRRLDNYSSWLCKQSRFEPGIDRLVEMADRLVY